MDCERIQMVETASDAEQQQQQGGGDGEEV